MSIVKSKSHVPDILISFLGTAGARSNPQLTNWGLKKRPSNTPLNPLCPMFVFLITLSFVCYSLCFFCLNFSFDLIAYTFSYYQTCFWSEGGQYTNKILRENGP